MGFARRILLQYVSNKHVVKIISAWHSTCLVTPNALQALALGPMYRACLQRETKTKPIENHEV